jgi:uncharacterized Ntn-hydrolase superfamily protein
MWKMTHSKGKINVGLASGAVLGAVIPIVAIAATGGLATVPVAMWIGLGSVVSGLLAGNVEPKTAVDRVLEAEANQAGRDGG